MSHEIYLSSYSKNFEGFNEKWEYIGDYYKTEYFPKQQKLKDE